MSGATKRMSQEEKRSTILGIYHSTKQVYTEKEIITLATKAGVNANTVQDINQMLVDDGLVEKEKIGGSNYFWSFPAKKDRQRQLQYDALVKSNDELRQKVLEAEAKLADAKRGREEEDAVVEGESNEGVGTTSNDENANAKNENKENATAKENKNDEDKELSTRAKKLIKLAELTAEKKALETEMEQLKQYDPQALANLEKELKFTKEAAERWTDNLFACKSYLVKKRGFSTKDACRMIGIPQDLDYPEDKFSDK